MPELPEVQTIVTALQSRVVGLRVKQARLLRPDVLRPAGLNLSSLLQGRRVMEIVRRGKKIIFHLDDRQRFYIHLGMTGRLTVENPRSELAPHTHLAVELDNDREMRFQDPRRFGGIWWVGTDEPIDAGMGPEPLTLKPSELFERLSHTHRAIKTALLDQSLVAGIGNIYADEAIFAARIHPLVPADKLGREEVAKLCRAIKTTLNRALRHKGSTLRDYRDADGNPGDFQKLHRVYDRAGQACVRCGTKIRRIVIGGRSAHFCPACQPAR